MSFRFEIMSNTRNIIHKIHIKYVKIAVPKNVQNKHKTLGPTIYFFLVLFSDSQISLIMESSLAALFYSQTRTKRSSC